MQGSLKQRLLLLSITTVVLVWMGTAVFTYYDANQEFNEILDAHLAQSAALLVAQTSHDLDEVEIAPILHHYSQRVAFQVWENGKLLRLHSVNAPTEPLSFQQRGFSNSVINKKTWRVFSTWDKVSNNLVMVAELTEERDELAAGIIANLLKPLLISLPLLTLLLWIAVTRGLRPLVRLTNEIQQRKPDALTPLDAGYAPGEVVPLINHLNRLFVRIEASMQQERRLTADAAHELRTPIAGIKAQAQVARGATNEAERTHALDNAIFGCDRAAHLIEQLLTLARMDALSEAITRSCSLRFLCAEVIATLAPAALNKGVRLELSEGNEASMCGDPLLLRILLRNLIDNAVRHTSKNTTVKVGVTNQPGQVRLTISDDGPGISDADLSRITERFYRPANTRSSGSGLGLSIVKRITEIHGATMQIAAQGTGLCVTVNFKTGCDSARSSVEPERRKT
jgi:two-component system sensor histidine kinase QseC